MHENPILALFGSGLMPKPYLFHWVFNSFHLRGLLQQLHRDLAAVLQPSAAPGSRPADRKPCPDGVHGKWSVRISGSI